jgi:MoaA/NifB/PqqE/SkfB family radical SAM enzyme
MKLDLATIARAAAAWTRLKPAPLSVGFELTHLCNLECAYCDRHTPLPGEMTREQILRALGELHALGMRHVSLDGGEPLAHRHVDEVVSFLALRGVRVFMNTNGILVPRKLATVRRLGRVKISLDGPRDAHDAVRGEGSYDKAIAGAMAARDAGVEVELTCVVGSHNAARVDELLDLVEALGMVIVFQPARNSLFLGTDRDGSAWQASADDVALAFSQVEARKRLRKSGGPVGNRWSSLRHFRAFPGDREPPCAAGWINVTMDPEGSLFHCGQVTRGDRSCNVVALGAKAAFERLERFACGQCWCARVVEENYAFGARVFAMRPLRPNPRAANERAATRNRLPILP